MVYSELSIYSVVITLDVLERQFLEIKVNLQNSREAWWLGPNHLLWCGFSIRTLQQHIFQQDI